jgi:uncharacterized protein (TIGR00251 family)
VTPRAAREGLSAADDYIAVRLRAPPVDGAANAALILALSRHFGIAKSAVAILSGETARLKRVRLTGDPARLRDLLEALAA